jgi:hypothetical protein
MVVFKLRIEQTYWSKGFFNVPVDFERFLSDDDGPLDLFLGDAVEPTSGRVTRSANRNATPRAFGNKPLQHFFQSQFNVGDFVNVEFVSPRSVRIGASAGSGLTSVSPPQQSHAAQPAPTGGPAVRRHAVVLVSCASEKLNHRAKAKDLYVSDLFQKSFAFAQRLAPKAVFILSAKHRLTNPDDEIDPYNATLNDMPLADVKAWAAAVFEQLRQRTDVEHDHFVFLAGDRYRRYLVPRLRSVEVPMEGLGIGEQLHFLKGRLAE